MYSGGAIRQRKARKNWQKKTPPYKKHHCPPKAPRSNPPAVGAAGDEEGAHEHLAAVHLARHLGHALHHRSLHRAVALQVAFERRILKPAFHLIGYRLWV
jgi:hypothetical protein